MSEDNNKALALKEGTVLCRESSLIQFNRRVLAQAADKHVPLLERLKFLCIVSSNIDEFFEVRVAALKRLDKLQPHRALTDGETPHEKLERIREEARQLINDQYTLLNDSLLPALEQEKVRFLKRKDWPEAIKEWIHRYFLEQIKPILTPIGLDPAHPFPKLLNKSLNFIVSLEGVDAFGRPTDLAIVQAPRILPRVVKLPKQFSEGEEIFVLLSSIIHAFAHELFLGMHLKGCYQFRVTRDSELTVDDDDLKNLLVAVQGELHERQYGEAVRLEVATNCPPPLVHFLQDLFQLKEDEVYRVNGPVNLIRLMAVPDQVNRPDLKYKPEVPAIPKNLKTEGSIFETLQKKNILLHHPYQSFEPVVELLQNAAEDPQVVAIKMTIYRAGSDSDIARALIRAALSGKEVTVVVELMARFDEEANVAWASRLEEAGAHVVYGVVGYKVHAKMLLIIREENKQLQRYAHLGTGNYHQKTTKLYTDFGLLTADPLITEDVLNIFMQITGLGQVRELKRLYESPFTLHPMLMKAIEKEIAHVKNGGIGKIQAKMNSLVEPQLISALYKASQAGVEINLVVRGICILKPGVPGLSTNIRVRSIIGRLLEHSRVFYFFDQGAEKTFISSADWMVRNMFDRVETCVPILDADLKKRILEDSFTLAHLDNQLAWIMEHNGTYHRAPFHPEKDSPFNMQKALFEKYSNQNQINPPAPSV